MPHQRSYAVTERLTKNYMYQTLRTMLWKLRSRPSDNGRSVLLSPDPASGTRFEMSSDILAVYTDKTFRQSLKTFLALLADLFV